MYYMDIDIDSDGKFDYRGVYFTPCKSLFLFKSKLDNDQTKNGYNTKTVYWFKYETIKWNILKTLNNKALIISDLILDSHEYYTNLLRSVDVNHQGNNTRKVCENNYMYSYMRLWLNKTFYETAFNSLEQQIIETTTVNNSANTTQRESNLYVCGNTDDKLFLLSYKEAITYYPIDNERVALSSDYAKSQGAFTYIDNGNSCYCLRSPSDSAHHLVNEVAYDGKIVHDSVGRNRHGVRPACWINL
jgi:hypothetical protein